MSISKVFIIGLPRTATTSVCVALLDMGIKTAHTVYWQKALDDAVAMADTPVFCDYVQLDQAYPNSKFVYLSRKHDDWLPSIKQLLLRMYKNLHTEGGGFNPIIKRCYDHVFPEMTIEKINDDDYLLNCYQAHQEKIYRHFHNRKEDLLTIDVSADGAFLDLANFLNIDVSRLASTSFQRINMAGKVTAWKQIRHPLKVESTNAGKVGKLRYGC